MTRRSILSMSAFDLNFQAGPLPPEVVFDQATWSFASGSDGERFRRCILPHDALIVARPAARRRVGRSRRDAYQEPRRRQLSPEQEAAIRSNAGSLSLRELAADFGVSHETVRAVLRRDGDVA